MNESRKESFYRRACLYVYSMGWLVTATILNPVAVDAEDEESMVAYVFVEITSIGVAGSGKSWAGSGTETDPFVVEYTEDDLQSSGNNFLLDIERVVDDPQGLVDDDSKFKIVGPSGYPSIWTPGGSDIMMSHQLNLWSYFGIHEYMYKYRSGGAYHDSGTMIFLEFREPSAEVHKISLRSTGTVWEGSGTETDPFIVEYFPRDQATLYDTNIELDIDIDIDDPLGLTTASTPSGGRALWYMFEGGMADISGTGTMPKAHISAKPAEVYEYVFAYRTWTPSFTVRETGSSIYLEFRKPSVSVNSISLLESGLVWAGSGTETDPFVVNYTQDDLVAGTHGPQFGFEIEMEVDDPLDFTEGGTYFIFDPEPNVALHLRTVPRIQSLGGGLFLPTSFVATGVYEYFFQYRGSGNIWYDSDSSIYLHLGGPYDADDEAEGESEVVVEEEEIAEEELDEEIVDFIGELISAYETRRIEVLEDLVSKDYREMRRSAERRETLGYDALIAEMHHEADLLEALRIGHTILGIERNNEKVRVSIRWKMRFQELKSRTEMNQSGITELVLVNQGQLQLITQRRDPLFGSIIR